MVARRAHNPKVSGSSPDPATTKSSIIYLIGLFFILKSMGKYFVYIIKSKEGFRYTGFTEDLEKRIKEHNNKELSFWTKRGTFWKLIYIEKYENKTEALKREKWLKSGVGRDFLKKNVRGY